MEDISNLILSLKNEANVIKEMESYQNAQLESFKADINSFNQEIEKLKELFSKKESLIIEKQNTLNDLEDQINKLENGNSQLEKTLSDKTEIKENFDKENINYDSNIQEIELENSSLRTSITELDKNVNDRKTELNKITAEINKVNTDHENSIAGLRSEKVNLEKQVKNLKLLHKAVKFFINQGLIKTPEMAVIETLLGKNQVTLDYIQKTTQSKLDVIQSTIGALEKRGILTYNSNTGQITIKKMIQL